LFIGNSRQRYRGIVRDAIDAQLPIAVYGLHWEGLIPAELVQGEQIANEDLHKFYSRCGILLNDHWDDMREKGFLSNRLFDAAACGAVVVSDDIAGLRDVFHDGVTCYDGSAADLAAKVAEIERRPEHYRELARRAREVVLEGHTFAHRAQEILCVVEAQNARRVFNASPAPDRQLPSEDTG
jgi:spore maturation protein CgeB